MCEMLTKSFIIIKSRTYFLRSSLLQAKIRKLSKVQGGTWKKTEEDLTHLQDDNMLTVDDTDVAIEQAE